MAIFQTQVIRIAADTTSKDKILDLATAAEPQAWWARDLTLQIGVFSDAGQTVLDVSDLQSVTIYLKDPSNLDGAPLVSKIITAFDNTTTLPTWQSGTQQHFSVAFTADDLSFSLTNGERLVHLSMVAVTTGGQTGTLCIGTINLIDDGGNAPAANPANAITVTQAQAMVTALAFNLAVQNLAANGQTTILNAQSWLAGRAPLSVQAGAGAFAAGVVLSPANALAGALLRIPIDFAASPNGTVNVYDASTGGPLIQAITNFANSDGSYSANSFYLIAGFDGTHWHKEFAAWVL